MSSIRERFDETLAIADPIDRAHAVNDLAFDAEQGVFSRAETIAVFEWIAALDRDDLLDAAVASAEEHLVLLGARTLRPLEAIVDELLHGFASLPERERLIATATSLTRQHGAQRPGSWALAAELLDAASAIAPLTGKDRRLHDEARAKGRATCTP